MAWGHLALQAVHPIEQGRQMSNPSWVWLVTSTSSWGMTGWPFAKVFRQCMLKCCFYHPGCQSKLCWSHTLYRP